MWKAAKKRDELGVEWGYGHPDKAAFDWCLNSSLALPIII